MELQIKTTVDEGKATISIVGEVDVSNAESMRKVVADLLQDEGVSEVVVDLAEVPYIDSTGIGVLVGGSARAREDGKTLCASNPQRAVARIFAMLGVDEVIK